MDELTRSLANFLVWAEFDRAANTRGGYATRRDFMARDDTRFILLRGADGLLTARPEPHLALVDRSAFDEAMRGAATFVLLGRRDGATLVCAQLPADAAAPAPLHQHGTFVDLRTAGPHLSRRDAALFAYAKAMTHWHERHRYCAHCGAPTRAAHGGHQRRCTACDTTHFPRIDPAVIVCVSDGEACLLGRQANWDAHRFSVIAGFVEPGESAEQAVVREVLEETDVAVDAVHYRSSQPWPFPGSLMLGYNASARRQPIRLRDGELAEADWFTRAEIIAGLQAGRLRLPPRLSIAYCLIEDWYNAGKHGKLRDVLRAYVPPEPAWTG